MKPLLTTIIRFYQKWISPARFPSCRFYPSCSEYAAQALDRFGVFKAFLLIVIRLGKCHPYHRGGHDPVK